MSLQAENAKTPPAAEPLFYRSIDDVVKVSSDAPVEAASVAAQPHVEPFDLEAELRAAHEKGWHEALAGAEREMQASLQQERDAVRRLVQQFATEKQRYFSEVEGEVVKLSLAIAERVLHREAEMDPMLLAGAARVALGQVADSSEAVLCVAASDVGRWNETLQASAKGMVIEADATMPRGEVILKTRSGTVHLGTRAQLQEIERGFFELLGRRPSLAV